MDGPDAQLHPRLFLTDLYDSMRKHESLTVIALQHSRGGVCVEPR